jgi:hypothetical protein
VKNVEKVLALCVLIALIFGWGVSTARLDSKADCGKDAQVRVQAIEIQIARMDARLERLPDIADKLDRLLESNHAN